MLDHRQRAMANTRSRTNPTKLPKLGAPRIIEAEADIRDGVRALRRKCAIMRAVHDMTGDRAVISSGG